MSSERPPQSTFFRYCSPQGDPRPRAQPGRAQRQHKTPEKCSINGRQPSTPFALRLDLTCAHVVTGRMCDVARNESSAGLSALPVALSTDCWESVLVHLPAINVHALRLVSSTVREAARSPPLWAAMTEMLIDSLQGVLVPEQADQNPVEYYFAVAKAQRQADAAALTATVISFKHDKDYAALRALGEVHNEGTPAAAFVPTEPIQLPVPAVVAVELVRLFSTVPPAKDPTGDKYRKASHALKGSPDLHQALRNLASQIASKKRDSALARPLSRLFPDAGRVTCGATPGRSPYPEDESPPPLNESAQSRAYYAPRKEKAKQQLFERMEQLVAAQAAQLVSLSSQLEGQELTTSRERGAKASLQRRFDTEKAAANKAAEAHAAGDGRAQRQIKNAHARTKTMAQKLATMRATLAATQAERTGLLKGYHGQVDAAAKVQIEKQSILRKEAELRAKQSSSKRQKADHSRVVAAAA